VSEPIIVTVVCDNPKHARGKVAKLATFVVNDDRPIGQGSGDRSRREARIESRAENGPDDWAFLLKGHEIPPCKLCGSRLPGVSVRSQSWFDAAIRRLAEAGHSTISLSVLLGNLINQEKR
jgi:hypothetical protein